MKSAIYARAGSAFFSIETRDATELLMVRFCHGFVFPVHLFKKVKLLHMQGVRGAVYMVTKQTKITFLNPETIDKKNFMSVVSFVN